MTAKATTKVPGGKTKTTKKRAGATKRAAPAKAARAAKKPAVKARVAKKPEKPADKSVRVVQENASDRNKRALRLWNIRLGIVLLVVAVAVVVAGDSSSAPLTTQYLANDALATEAAGGTEVLAPAVRHVADVPISWIVAKFLAIAAGAYLLAATLWRERYEAWFDQGVNKLRWAGFGLAGGVAVAGIAMLGGVSDLATLLLIFGSVALASVFAAALEQLGPNHRLRRLLSAGAVAGLALPVVGYIANVAGALKYNGSLPMYLYFVYAVVVLWFVAIALAAHFRAERRGKWAGAFYAEKAYMLLGFAAAVVLALQIFVGALQS